MDNIQTKEQYDKLFGINAYEAKTLTPKEVLAEYVRRKFNGKYELKELMKLKKKNLFAIKLKLNEESNRQTT